MNWLYRVLGVVALSAAPPAMADSWGPAERTVYLSADKATRFTAIPRDLRDRLAYFSDKVKGKEPAGQRADGEPRARGILERRRGAGWTKIWEAPLLNEVAPVSALVANGGDHVVTFDNWHSMGFGDNVVVIYRRDGSLVRSMTLTDILPEDYVRALPTSVSSMWWSGDHVLSDDGRRLILKVVVPGRDNSIDARRGYVDVPVDLATGAVGTPSGPAWEQAMAAAAPLAAQSKSGEAAWRAERIAPLRAPAGTDGDEWRRYLYRAADRLLDPAADRHPFSNEWVLPAESDARFAVEAKEIREAFASADRTTDLMLASPAAPDALARLLIAAAETAGPGKLTGARVLVALPAGLADRVRAAFVPSGASVVAFDPATSIPQRAETLRELGVAPDAVEAEAAKAVEASRRYMADAVRLGALAPPEPAPKRGEDEDLEAMADRLAAMAEQAGEPRK